MKKITAIAVLLLAARCAIACDICGCSAGASYMGILPRFKSHFIGIRHNYSSSVSEHPRLFANEALVTSNEYFNTTELWGRYVPHKRVQLFGFLPYNQFSKTEQGVEYNTSGLGDVTVIANYIVLNTADSLRRKWTHALQAGAGVKLPTGNYRMQQNGAALNPNLQPGSGSVDIPLNVIYTVRYKKTGLNAEANYRINTTNSNGYKFGNRTACALRLFYWQNIKGASVLPSAGVAFEHNRMDINNRYVQEYTGNRAFLGNAGLDVYFKRVAVTARYFTRPFSQHSGEGQIRNGEKLSASIIFLF